ncbi:hypothetical protein ACHHYP_01096 [Achlya hypogyna]|uniref:Transmembrane protein n=1 Tax=Achlya hypogyna TaxID=1202772 RepID=A0A1V9Z9S1_ACHHY|nr:hypothetical protein ACHHYP_01096 [Achlya hypogyna]
MSTAKPLGENGLPRIRSTKPQLFVTAILVTVPALMGYAIAYYGIYLRGPVATYDARIAALERADLHWACAAVVVLGRLVAFVNGYPMAHKGRIVLPRSGNLRVNPYFYKTIGVGATENLVALVEDGVIGQYNRANRSLHHMIENYGAVLAGLVLGAKVFPYDIFVITAAFGVGRVLHQVGYTWGFGGHAVGFYIATLAANALEGLHLIVVLKIAGYV